MEAPGSEWSCFRWFAKCMMQHANIPLNQFRQLSRKMNTQLIQNKKKSNKLSDLKFQLPCTVRESTRLLFNASAFLTSAFDASSTYASIAMFFMMLMPFSPFRMLTPLKNFSTSSLDTRHWKPRAITIWKPGPVAVFFASVFERRLPTFCHSSANLIQTFDHALCNMECNVVNFLNTNFSVFSSPEISQWVVQPKRPHAMDWFV